MSSPDSQQSTQFDYIIIGGGSAGCVLAARLSENPECSVCLVEAGGSDRHPYISTPAGVGAAIMKPEFGWGLMTVPQANLGNRQIPLPRGKILGGSGSINGMAYYRGHALDYDDWAKAGNEGWSYADLLPYFLRSEHNPDYSDSPFHNTGGPMGVSYVPSPNKLCEAFNEAMAEKGFEHCEDFNVAEPDGYGYRQGNIWNGKRVSTSSAYLRPVLKRANLTVMLNTSTRRLLMVDKKVIGVEVQTKTGVKQLQVGREVILSAGAFHSPHILLNSGIGDRKHLEKVGVQTLHHLPGVGKDLHDHPATYAALDMKDSTSYGLSFKTIPRALWNGVEYLLAGQGPLGSNLFETNAYIRSKDGLDRPDMQVVFQPARRNPKPFPLPLGHGYAISLVCLYPKSRGSVTLASNDPMQAPLIDPALASDDEDIQTLVRGLKLAREILASSSFDRYKASERMPGKQVKHDYELEAYVRETYATVHHPGGSCKMGKGRAAVVDHELKVRGIEGLRVADASVYPRVPGANTNASVVVIAEKAADMILGIEAPAPILTERTT